MKRKLLSILALLCLTVSSAWAQGPWTSGDCTVTLSDGVMTISGTGAMTNYPGASNQPWKDYRSSITSVVIGDGVTSIGNYAFSSCSNLETVTIPSGVTSIGNSAFAYCSKLNSVTIPNSVTSIGNSAFNNCSKLTSVTIPDNVTSIGSYTFNNCSSLASVIIPDKVTTISNHAFNSCSNLTSVTIGNSVTTIGNNAFTNSGLTSVTIPTSVTSIGDYAFYGCGKLTEISVDAGNTVYSSEDGVLFNKEKTTLIQYPCSKNATSYEIPSTVTSIGNYAFSSSGLTSVIIPDKVTTIGNYAFNYCSDLTSVTIPNSVTTIGNYAFSNSGLTSVTIPDNVTTISGNAFYSCNSLETATIGSGVTSIGAEAFTGCGKLTEISVDAGNTKYSSEDGVLFDKEKTTLIQYPCYKNATSYEIPSSVTSINANAFRECTSLTTVTIPSTVTSIGNHAFRDCTKLTTATIPDKVTSIGNYAFNNCYNLSSVTIYSPSLITYGEYAFNINKPGRKIYVFNDKVETYQAATNWSSYASDILPITLTANEGATGEYWTTYYNDLANAKVPSGAQAFKATLSGTTLTLTEIEDGIITKGTGVVIKSTSASVLPESSATGSSDTNANNLQGTMTSITNPGNAYVLNKDEGGVGFYKLSSGGTIGAHKAYLTYSGSLAREFFAFNEATGINSATLTNSEKVNNEVYDLQGRRVVNPTKGLYIVNGKKVIKR